MVLTEILRTAILRLVELNICVLCSSREGKLRGKQVRILRGPATVFGELQSKAQAIHWETGKEICNDDP